MPTAEIALLASLVSLFIAWRAYADGRVLRRVEQRSVALSATYTASLLLEEAASVTEKVDEFLETPGACLDPEVRLLYDDYRRITTEDRNRIEQAMAAVAYGNPSEVECRAIAARSTMVVHRTIASRKDALRVLRQIRSR